MKIFVDENIPSRTLDELLALGHEVGNDTSLAKRFGGSDQRLDPG